MRAWDVSRHIISKWSVLKITIKLFFRCTLVGGGRDNRIDAHVRHYERNIKARYTVQYFRYFAGFILCRVNPEQRCNDTDNATVFAAYTRASRRGEIENFALVRVHFRRRLSAFRLTRLFAPRTLWYWYNLVPYLRPLPSLASLSYS